MVGAHSFSLMQFFADPLRSFTFLCLILTTMTFWAYRRLWIWGPLLAFSCVCAYFSNLIDLSFLIPLGTLFVAYLALKLEIPLLARWLVLIIIILLSLGLSFHLFPSIHNWLLVDSIQLSPGAPSFTYYWNFDKPFIGIFALGLSLNLLKTKHEIHAILTKTLAYSLSFVGLFLVGSLFFNIVHFDFKIPSLIIPWLIGNLFFTVIPEEVFFRGVLQTELTKSIPCKAGPHLANLILSAAFALSHMLFVPTPSYIVAAFLASFCYGFIFNITKAIESAIFAHYLLNVIHFIFFTYPILTV